MEKIRGPGDEVILNFFTTYIIDWPGSGLSGKNWDDVIPTECLGNLTNGGIVVDVPVVVVNLLIRIAGPIDLAETIVRKNNTTEL